ncbi:conserved hypothetical protein [Hahella chejuensis KCTC 2396]|uniref:DUF4350 domain-containing protein n=1 Tax=Hahella chejuensis (strain KCTC 2396) TaxID=349521 RepID=Q2SQ97_HAHCH|nr:DUF4350 domain-containing protein [Hahella chejuensis]ABC27177.1 conserved hypothetical protein [Hahella chejuensis KCTC 2396]
MQRSNSFAAIGIVIAVLVLVALGVYWYQGLEWIEYERDLGPNEKARREPFLAAQLFIEKRGYKLESNPSFRDFDDPDFALKTSTEDAIVLVDAYGSLSQKRTQTLLEWVERGGHLMVTAKNPYLKGMDKIQDPIFEEFGVEVERNGQGDFDEELWGAISTIGGYVGITQEDLCPMLYPQAEFSFEGDENSIGVHFLSNDTLYGQDDYLYASVGPDGASRMLQYEYGDGMVTYMVSLDMWKNFAIGCQDHAYMLWQMAPGDSGVMHFYYNRDFPSLGSVLWRHFYAAIAVGALTLFLWLWYRGMRFGPLRDEEPGTQRQILEHIAASARFLWRMDKGQALVESVRAETWQAISKRLQHITRLEQSVQIAQLAKHFQMNEQAVEAALFGPIPNDPVSFVNIIRALKRIKDKL